MANAGVMFSPYDTTADGYELQFGTNHSGTSRSQLADAAAHRRERRAGRRSVVRRPLMQHRFDVD